MIEQKGRPSYILLSMASNTLMESINQIVAAGFARWLIVVSVFLLAFAGLSAIWSILRKKLLKSPDGRWDGVLFRAIGGPLHVLFFFMALGLAVQLAPGRVRAHPALMQGVRIGLIIGGIWLAERILESLVRTSTHFFKLSATGRSLATTVLRVTVISIGLLIVLDTIGISVTPLLASLGVSSIVVALALQETLKNFFAGLYLMTEQPIRIGDFVRVMNDVEGHVVKIGWRNTRIELPSNNVVFVPNSDIASSRITNYCLPTPEASISIPMGVAYSSDLERVEKITIEVAREIQQRVEGAVHDFAPSVRFNTLADSSINFSVNLRVKGILDRHLLTHEFIKAVHKRFNAEGIELPFPQRVVHLVNPTKAT